MDSFNSESLFTHWYISCQIIIHNTKSQAFSLMLILLYLCFKWRTFYFYNFKVFLNCCISVLTYVKPLFVNLFFQPLPIDKRKRLYKTCTSYISQCQPGHMLTKKKENKKNKIIIVRWTSPWPLKTHTQQAAMTAQERSEILVRHTEAKNTHTQLFMYFSVYMQSGSRRIAGTFVLTSTGAV